MEPTHDDQDGSGLDRRSVLRRGAVLGGAMVWTVPAVQTIAGPAFATGTPRCDTSLRCEVRQRNGTMKCMVITYQPSEGCCACIAKKTGAGKSHSTAVTQCARSRACVEQSSRPC